jgi:hypothetical protein
VQLKDEFKPLNGIPAVGSKLYIRTIEYLRWNVGDRIVKLWYFSKSYGKSFLGFKNRKVFVIGRNKTGTTSLYKALSDLGYRMGSQKQAERMIEHWGVRDFRRLIRYCHLSDAFQDVPFSYHYTFQAMDAAFPGSKFILSVRCSPDEWYQSLIRYQMLQQEKVTGEYRLPTTHDLKLRTYNYKGYAWRKFQLVGIGLDTNEVYPEDELKAYYIRHNEIVIDYFRNRPNDLLVLNLAESDSMKKLSEFLGHPYDGRPMPKLNQSR